MTSPDTDRALDDASTADGPGPGAQSATVPVALDDNDITLTPDASLLTGPNTQYPVYIDPDWHTLTQKVSGYDEVQQGCPSTSNYNNSNYDDNALGVGYNGWSGCIGIERSYYQFSFPTATWGADIHSATFKDLETESSSSSTSTVTISESNVINSGTDWNNQPGPGTQLASASVGPANGSNSAGFNVTSFFASGAAGHWSAIAFVLRGDESNEDNFKRFSSNPSLTVQFDQPPSVPQLVSTSPSLPCDATGNPPFGYLGNTELDITAKATQPDAEPVRIELEIWQYGTGNDVYDYVPTTYITSGKSYTFQIPASTFPYSSSNTVAQNTFSWNMRTSDYFQWSAWSTPCHFTVDHSTPAPPTVTSTTYPEGSDSTTVGTTGEFDISPGDAETPAQYVYSLNTEPPTTAYAVTKSSPWSQGTAITADASGDAAIQLTPTKLGANTLYVYALDAAGNPSLNPDGTLCVTSYTFYTAPLDTSPPVSDLNGDGKPDLIGIGNSSHPGLWLYPATDYDGTLTGTQSVDIGANGAGANMPDSTGTPADWTGAQVSFGYLDFNTDTDTPNILAKFPDGTLVAYETDGTGDILDVSDESESSQLAVEPVGGGSESGGQAFSSTDQVIAAPWPDTTGGSFSDVIAVVGTGLYLYQPTGLGASYNPPVLLDDSVDWSQKTIAAATVNNTPALWVRDNTTGELDLYTGDFVDQQTLSTATKTVYASSGWTSSSDPIAGDDLNLDGQPDLWSINSSGYIYTNINNGNGGFQPASGQGSGWLNWFSNIA